MNRIERLRTWKETDYFKEKLAIYDEVLKMEHEGTHKTNKDDYNKLFNELENLIDEEQELKKIRKKARRNARKRLNKLWKEQEELPMKSFIVCLR